MPNMGNGREGSKLLGPYRAVFLEPSGETTLNVAVAMATGGF